MFPDTRLPHAHDNRLHAPLPLPRPGSALPEGAPDALTGQALYWRGRADDELTVRVRVVPRSRIAVDLWWNRHGGSADVQLVVGLYDDAVELGSLTGNGFDAPRFHRAGFGTLAVNLGIRALQATCGPLVSVHGVLSNTAEDSLAPEQREPLEAARRAFWRRFGLAVVAVGEPPLDYLRGTVGGLRVVADGRLAGQFARDLDLREFTAIAPAGF
jgi:hypothetical protein